MELMRAADKDMTIFDKITHLDLQNLNISDHTLGYLKRYFGNSDFYEKAYSQLMKKAIKSLIRPVNESTFIDYGGGCGILSFLAREAGFRTVVYNDIFRVSVNDAQTIAAKMDITIDHFICGDAGALVKEIEKNKIDADLICSFDVVEHIYDLEEWITTVSSLNRFTILFHTTANPVNPFIRRRLKKNHEIAEYIGCEMNIRLNDSFLGNSILKQREIIIGEKFPGLSSKEIFALAVKSRGLIKEDIEKLAGEYISSGSVSYRFDHPTNTCEPYTGNWAERLIDLKRLRDFLQNQKLRFTVTNSYYCYSNRRFLNIVKFLLNTLIFIMGRSSLFLSPAITLEIEKGNF